MAGKFEVYTDKAGKYRFRLKASNGQIIAAGEGYESKRACLNGIQSIKRNAPEAPVVEVDDWQIGAEPLPEPADTILRTRGRMPRHHVRSSLLD